jgi:hypothetical protein
MTSPKRLNRCLGQHDDEALASLLATFDQVQIEVKNVAAIRNPTLHRSSFPRGGSRSHS